jgi:HK97 gp10 family phage protein
MTVEWNDKRVLRAVDREVDKVERRLSQMVRRTAQALAPKLTGTLAIETTVKKSKYRDGGYIVQSQGPGNYSRYYASFVEFGAHNAPAQPFLRPATNKYKIIGKLLLKRAIE